MIKRSRRIRNAEKPVMTATKARALNSITPEQAKKGGFEAQPFSEFDKEMGTMENYRLVRKAPVKALERLVRQNGNSAPFLDPVCVQAANLYHIERLQAQGGSSVEIADRVDMSDNPGGTQLFLLDMQQRLSRIRCRMAPDLYSVIDEIFTHHDKTLSQLWPDSPTRRVRKGQIEDALYWLAGEYHLTTRN